MQTGSPQQTLHATFSSESNGRVAMLYDGGCPLCSKEVAHYQRIDRDGNVCWIDIDSDTRVLAALGLNRETAMKHLHVVDKHGGIVKGAYAFATVWAELPRYRHLAKLVTIPGVLPVLDKAYNIFASIRFNRRSRCDDNLCS